ncbi:hypothetical protein HYW75_02850 [Candidatus Pacearchaeota archaeon]|nr:hypothetical protein [Candidatus Pacearchaeota archaeon]
MVIQTRKNNDGKYILYFSWGGVKANIDPTIGGIILFIFGILLFIFNNSLGRIAYLGMHSIESMITNTSKEEVYKKRAWFIKYLGAIFIIVGLIFIINGLI